MRAIDLRIGNYIKVKGKVDVVLGIADNDYCTENYGHGVLNSDIKPIELTEELLKKEPYKTKQWKGNGQDYQPETSKTKQVYYYLSEDIYLVFETWSWRKKEADEWIDEHGCYIDFYGKDIHLTKKEVHILQNLYFALTGNELLITN
jgi:hypothetical protein